MRHLNLIVVAILMLLFKNAYSQTTDTKEDYSFKKNEIVPEISFFLGGSTQVQSEYGYNTHAHLGLKLAANFRGAYLCYNFRIYSGLTIPQIESSVTAGYRFYYKKFSFGGGAGLGRVFFQCTDESREGPCYYYDEGKYNCYLLESDVSYLVNKFFALGINFSENLNERKNATGVAIAVRFFPCRIKVK